MVLKSGLTATASDNVAVANVQFKVDGTNIGSAVTSSPYTTAWNSTGVSDDSHTLYAVAVDTSGNYATSSISVTVSNSPPVISSISSGTPTTAAATITWTTDEAANSKVVYGTTSAYGSATSSARLVTSHSIVISGLTSGAIYHYAVVSVDGQGNTATLSDQTFTTSYCPMGNSFSDGCANAPVGGSFQQSSFFTSYALQSGQTHSTRPAWNVAGVDYPVGIPAASVNAGLKNPAVDTLPAGCTYHTSPGPYVQCDGSNVVLDGWLFNDVYLTLHTCLSNGSFTIQNSKFVMGPNIASNAVQYSMIEIDGSGCDALLQDNVFDGNVQNLANQAFTNKSLI